MSMREMMVRVKTNNKMKMQGLIMPTKLYKKKFQLLRQRSQKRMLLGLIALAQSASTNSLMNLKSLDLRKLWRLIKSD